MAELLTQSWVRDPTVVPTPLVPKAKPISC